MIPTHCSHYKGATALGVLIIESNNPQIVRTLISLGANVNPRFTRGRDERDVMSTPLVAACLGPAGPLQMTSVLRLLLEAGADVNGRKEIVGLFSGTPLLAATLLGEADAVRIFLQQPNVDIHATGICYSWATNVPYATNVSAIDVARGKLRRWADRNPGGIQLAAFDQVLDMLTQRLHEDCVALAKHVLGEQHGVDAAQDANVADRPHDGNRLVLSTLWGLKADTERLQCTGKPFVRELAALGREILPLFSAAGAGLLE